MSATEVLQRKHTRREFRERMQSGELKACIIPVAAIEQHLEHLAMEQDWRSVCHVATAVAERFRPHVLDAEGLMRSEEHTSELQSRLHLVCRLLLEKKKKNSMKN